MAFAHNETGIKEDEASHTFAFENGNKAFKGTTGGNHNEALIANLDNKPSLSASDFAVI